MGTYILSTVGTSLLGNLKREGDFDINDPSSKQKALARLMSVDIDDRLCGAEINSLASLIKNYSQQKTKFDPPCKFTFLVSDTDAGNWTGELLKSYFEDNHKWREVESVNYEIIEGLTDKNPTEFKTKGLRNLVQLASKHLKDAVKKYDHRIINATGGYKAQISFAGLIGQVLGIPVVYMFENFTSYIEMPPIPVDFTYDLWLEHYTFFNRMGQEDTLSWDEVSKWGIDSRIRDLLEMVEVDGEKYVSLSPILTLMHEGFLLRWPRELERPPSSAVPQKERLQLKVEEMSHAPRRSEDIARKVIEFDWINKIKNIRYVNTTRSSVKSRSDGGKPDEINFVWADSDKGIEFIAFTTCENDSQRLYCINELNELLDKRS